MHQFLHNSSQTERRRAGLSMRCVPDLTDIKARLPTAWFMPGRAATLRKEQRKNLLS
jgi:hypothetical protein